MLVIIRILVMIIAGKLLALLVELCWPTTRHGNKFSIVGHESLAKDRSHVVLVE